MAAKIANLYDIPIRSRRNLTTITIPAGVTAIGDGVFRDCIKLEKFEGKFVSADKRCLVINGVFKALAPADLTQYTIPDNVTEIGSEAFGECSSLTSITIPNSVTQIGSYAFCDCSNLASITIPESVTEIGEWAFEACYNIASVYCKPTTPPTVGKAFGDISDSAKIFVPAASVDAYKAAEGWKDYAGMIVGYDF